MRFKYLVRVVKIAAKNVLTQIFRKLVNTMILIMIINKTKLKNQNDLVYIAKIGFLISFD